MPIFQNLMELKYRVGYTREIKNWTCTRGKEKRKGKEHIVPRENMSRKEYIIRKIKREIRKEIEVEIAALKKLIPLFVGSAVLCAGGYAWSILLFGIL